MTFCNGYQAAQQALDQPPHRRRARQIILRPPFTMNVPARMMPLPSEKPIMPQASQPQEK
jgi:hypothetical protein